MARFVQLLVSDVPAERAADVRDEWINLDRVERIEPYLEVGLSGPSAVWLELAFASGQFRYVPVGPLDGRTLLEVAGDAIGDLLEIGHEIPVVVACL